MHDDTPDTPHQVFQDTHFPPWHGNGFAVDQNFAGRGVEGYVADVDNQAEDFARTPQQGTNSGYQFFHGKGFQQVIIAAAV